MFLYFIAGMTQYRKHKLTFCFTDIKGSTKLAIKLGKDYPKVLDGYRGIIRSELHNYNGQVIDSPGDGFFISFSDPVAAVKAVSSIQQKISGYHWPKNEQVLVRIGLNTGEAIESGNGYTGLEVNKTARICDAARAGQVLLSSSTRDSIIEFSDGLQEMKSLGKYELKDFETPEELFQLIVPHLNNEFAPPRTLPSLPVVAVLPFTNLSKDPDQEYFCDGISAEIISALARIQGLRVVARSSSFALKGQVHDARKTGQVLSAAYLLEGTVQTLNKRLHITVELVDTKTGFTLWSGQFDRLLQDVFAIEDEIAQSVARTLDVPVVAQKSNVQDTQTRNIEAYDFYLRGRTFYYKFSRQGIEFALQMFRKAIEIDASYALAYCGIADCYSYLYMYEEQSKANLEAAESASKKAIDLNPNLAQASASLGVALSLQKDYAAAEVAFEQAIKLDPRLFEAYYLYARVAFVEGKLDKAGGLFREANRVRPEDYQSLLLAGQCFDDLGMKRRAKEVREEGVKIVERHLLLNPGDTRALSLGANGLIILGQTEKSLEWLNRALALEPGDPMLLYNAGCIYSLGEMPDKAMDFLEKSVEEGLTQKGWYENDNNLDPLRTYPRFKRLLEKLS
jgi:adenylate cyclase